MNVPAVPSRSALDRHAGDSMLMSTTEELPGYRVIRVLGLVRGKTVRVRHFGVDFMAGLRSLVGGEISDYTKMLAESREQSLDRMRAEALTLGANAIRRDLGRQTMEEVTALLKQSIQYGLDHREEALKHALQYGRDLDRDQADQFVGMYVNDWTLDFGPRGREAVATLLNRGYEAGIVPRPVELEFIG